MKTKKQFLWMLFIILVCGFTAMTMVSCSSDDDDDSGTGGILNTPLTLEAISDGDIFFNNTTTDSIVYYKLNGSEPKIIPSSRTTTIKVKAGDQVEFFGDNNIYGYVRQGKLQWYSSLRSNADCYIYGNIMSLIKSTDFASATTLTGKESFSYFFSGAKHFKNHPTKKFILGATKLSERCYLCMFENSNGFTPILPATTLAEMCYEGMFEGCTGLTEAPELPATTLAEGCYDKMFSGCKNLSKVTSLATNISAKAIYKWLEGVSPTGTFTKAKGVEWPTGISGIPEGWTVVEQ